MHMNRETHRKKRIHESEGQWEVYMTHERQLVRAHMTHDGARSVYMTRETCIQDRT